MATFTITRGLPASGKTTLIRKLVDEDPHGVRVNRDSFRMMMFGKYWTGMTDTEIEAAGITREEANRRLTEDEIAVTKATDASVAALLDRGFNVYQDNTCLPQRHARDARMLALRHGADFRVIDMTNVPLDVCLTRDRQRIANGERGVGDDVINTMWWKFLRGKQYPLALPEEPNPSMPGDLYIPDDSLPEAYIVDIDGTVAQMAGRSPYDETRVHEDRPKESVIRVIQRLWLRDAKIIFVSGRHDVCYDATRAWLNEHVGITYELIMRKDGDNRKDYIIKREIFDSHIRPNYNVLGCFDDRDQVVEMYRNLGLTVFQVAPGKF